MVERPEVLLTILQGTAPTTKSYLVRNASSADIDIEKPLSSIETDRRWKVNWR